MLPPQFPHRNAGLRFIAAFLALSFTLPSPAFALRPSGADDERGSVRAGLEDQLLGSPKKWLGTLLVSLLGFLPVPDLAGAPPVNQRPAEMPFNASHPDLGPYFSDPDGSRWLKWGRSFAYVHGPDLLKGFNVKKVVSNPQQPVQKLIEMVQPLSPEMKRFSNLEAIQGLQRSKLELSPKNVNADLQLQKRLRRMVEKEIIGPRSFVLVTHGHFVAGIAGLAGFTSKGGEQYLFDTAIYFPRGEWPVRSASAQNAADLQLQLWAESIQRARQEHQDKKRKAAGGIAVGLFGHRDELEPTELAFGTAYIDPEKLFGKPKDFRRFFRDRGFQNLVIVTEEPTLNPDRINLLPLKRLEDGVFGNKDLYGYMRRLQELGIPVEVVNGDMRPPGGVFGRKLAEEDKSRPHPKETPPSPKQAGAEETTRFRSGTVNADVFRDIGGRSKQEDASGSVETLDPQGRVLVKSFLVLDGMGGLGAGHIASGEALETLRDYLRGEPFGRVIARYSAASSLAEEEKWERQLRAKAIKYIQGAEERLIAVAASKKLSRMGTTLTLALLLESKFRGLHAYLFSVGDSPAYHYHAATGRVDLLTVEDTIDSFYIRRELIEESQSPAVSWKDWFFSFMGIRKPPPKPITPESFWDPKTLSGDPAALRLLVQRLRDPDPEKPHNPGLTSYLGAEGARSDGGFKTPLNDSSIKPVRVLLKPGDGLLLATDGISKGLSQQAPKEGDEIRFLEGIFEEQKDQPVSVLVRRVGELSAGKPHGDNRTAYAIFLTAPTPAAGAEETVQERVNKLLLPIAMFPDDARQKALAELRQIGPEATDFLIEALKERPTLERANWILPTGAAIALRTIATNLSPDERLRAISSLQEILSIQTLRELRKMDPKMELHPHTWLSWVLPAAIRALQAIDRKAAADALYRLERDTVKEHGSLAAVVDKALENASSAGAEEVERLAKVLRNKQDDPGDLFQAAGELARAGLYFGWDTNDPAVAILKEVLLDPKTGRDNRTAAAWGLGLHGDADNLGILLEALDRPENDPITVGRMAAAVSWLYYTDILQVRRAYQSLEKVAIRMHTLRSPDAQRGYPMILGAVKGLGIQTRRLSLELLFSDKPIDLSVWGDDLESLFKKAGDRKILNAPVLEKRFWVIDRLEQGNDPFVIPMLQHFLKEGLLAANTGKNQTRLISVVKRLARLLKGDAALFGGSLPFHIMRWQAIYFSHQHLYPASRFNDPKLRVAVEQGWNSIWKEYPPAPPTAGAEEKKISEELRMKSEGFPLAPPLPGSQLIPLNSSLLTASPPAAGVEETVIQPVRLPGEKSPRFYLLRDDLFSLLTPPGTGLPKAVVIPPKGSRYHPGKSEQFEVVGLLTYLADAAKQKLPGAAKLKKWVEAGDRVLLRGSAVREALGQGTLRGLLWEQKLRRALYRYQQESPNGSLLETVGKALHSRSSSLRQPDDLERLALEALPSWLAEIGLSDRKRISQWLHKKLQVSPEIRQVVMDQIKKSRPLSNEIRLAEKGLKGLGESGAPYRDRLRKGAKFTPEGGFELDLPARPVPASHEPRWFQSRTVQIRNIAFSPDGKTLAGGGDDGTVQLWNIATGNELLRWRDWGPVQSIAFSPDGRTLASGGDDGTVQLWDVATGVLRSRLNYPGPVQSIAFSPDGKTLAGGGLNNDIALWNIPPAAGAEEREISEELRMKSKEFPLAPPLKRSPLIPLNSSLLTASPPAAGAEERDLNSISADDLANILIQVLGISGENAKQLTDRIIQKAPFQDWSQFRGAMKERLFKEQITAIKQSGLLSISKPQKAAPTPKKGEWPGWVSPKEAEMIFGAFSLLVWPTSLPGRAPTPNQTAAKLLAQNFLSKVDSEALIESFRKTSRDSHRPGRAKAPFSLEKMDFLLDHLPYILTGDSKAVLEGPRFAMRLGFFSAVVMPTVTTLQQEAALPVEPRTREAVVSSVIVRMNMNPPAKIYREVYPPEQERDLVRRTLEVLLKLEPSLPAAGVEETTRHVREYDPVEVANRLLSVLVEEEASGEVILSLKMASQKLKGFPTQQGFSKNTVLVGRINKALRAVLGKRRPADDRLGELWKKFRTSGLTRVRIGVALNNVGRPRSDPVEWAERLLSALVREGAQGKRTLNLTQAAEKMGSRKEVLSRDPDFARRINRVLNEALGGSPPVIAKLKKLWDQFHASELTQVRIKKEQGGRPRSRSAAAGAEEVEQAEQRALEVLGLWADAKSRIPAGQVLPAIVLGPSLVKRYEAELSVLNRLLKHPKLSGRNPTQDSLYLVTDGSQTQIEFPQQFATADEARRVLNDRPIIYLRGNDREELFSAATTPQLKLETLSSGSSSLGRLKFLLANIRFAMTSEISSEAKQPIFKEADLLAASLQRISEEHLPSFSPEQARILVVEDEIPLQKKLVEAIWGALQSSSSPLAHQITREQIVAFDRVPEAIQWIEKEEPQFVWTDFVLRKGYGYEVARAAKGIRSTTRVVLSSGMTTAKAEELLEDRDFAQFIQKPASSKSIQAAVEKYVIQRLASGAEEKQPTELEPFANPDPVSLDRLQRELTAVAQALSGPGKADLTAAWNLAKQIDSRLRPPIPPAALAASDREAFRRFQKYLLWNVFLRANRLFEIDLPESPSGGRPLFAQGIIQPGTWKKHPYLDSAVWSVEMDTRGSDLLYGMSYGPYAFVNSKAAREEANILYPMIQALEEVGSFSQDTVSVFTALRSQLQQSGFNPELYAERLGAVRNLYEHLRFAQDHLFAELWIKADPGTAPDEFRLQADYRNQVLGAILKQNASLKQFIESDDLELKMNRRIREFMVARYAGKLGGLMREMRMHRDNARDDLAYAAFLDYLAMGELNEEEFARKPQGLWTGEDWQRHLVFRWFSSAIADVSEQALGSKITTHSGLISALEMSEEPPGQRALRLVEGIYALDFWSDRERLTRLLERRRLPAAGVEEAAGDAQAIASAMDVLERRELLVLYWILRPVAGLYLGGKISLRQAVEIISNQMPSDQVEKILGRPAPRYFSSMDEEDARAVLVAAWEVAKHGLNSEGFQVVSGYLQGYPQTSIPGLGEATALSILQDAKIRAEQSTQPAAGAEESVTIRTEPAPAVSSRFRNDDKEYKLIGDALTADWRDSPDRTISDTAITFLRYLAADGPVDLDSWRQGRPVQFAGVTLETKNGGSSAARLLEMIAQGELDLNQALDDLTRTWKWMYAARQDTKALGFIEGEVKPALSRARTREFKNVPDTDKKDEVLARQIASSLIYENANIGGPDILLALMRPDSTEYSTIAKQVFLSYGVTAGPVVLRSAPRAKKIFSLVAATLDVMRLSRPVARVETVVSEEKKKAQFERQRLARAYMILGLLNSGWRSSRKNGVSTVPLRRFVWEGLSKRLRDPGLSPQHFYQFLFSSSGPNSPAPSSALGIADGKDLRWAQKLIGFLLGHPVGVLTLEELRSLSDSEILARISARTSGTARIEDAKAIALIQRARQMFLIPPASGVEEAEQRALEVLGHWADAKSQVPAGQGLPAIVLGPSLVRRYAGELSVLNRLLKHPQFSGRNPTQDSLYLVTDGSQTQIEFPQQFATADEARQALSGRPISYLRGNEQEELFSAATTPQLELKTLSSQGSSWMKLKFLLTTIRSAMTGEISSEAKQLISKEAKLLATALQRLSQEQLPAFSPQQARILVVEDEIPLQKKLVETIWGALQSSSSLLAHQITREQIAVFDRVSEAIQWAEKEEPQFVWTDFVLVGGSGYQVAQAAKGVRSTVRVVLSSNIDTTKAEKLLEDRDFDQFIQKPASSESIREAVEKYVIQRLAAGAEEAVNRLMAEAFGARGELPIRWVGTNSSGESSFLEDSYRLALKWRVWGSARDGSLEVSVDLDFRPLGKERKLSRSAREAMEKYSFRVIGPVGSPQVPFQKLVAESPDYEYGDEGGRYMDGRLKLELTPEEASKLKSAGTFFLIQVSPPSPVAINPADLSAASETTPVGSVNITEQPLHWVALQQFLAHFQPGQQVWTKELARMFPSTPEENLARFLEEIGWRKGARKDDVNPGQGLRFFKVSGVQVAVSPQEVVFFLSQTHAIFLAPFGWIMGPLQQLIGQKRVLEITVNGAPLSMEYQPDGVVIELGRALKEAGIAGQLQLRFEREGARLKVSSPAAGPIPPTPAAGAEESVVASALNSPDIRRRLKESGFAPVEGGFLARPLLFENEGRLFLQAGLEEPRGMPKQVPIFWADEATVAGMLGYVKKMGVSSQDGFLFNGKSFTLTQAMAVLPLPMPASAILDPRVQPTASEVAVILHLSRRTGTLYVVRITRLTFGESQEPLLFIQIQA